MALFKIRPSCLSPLATSLFVALFFPTLSRLARRPNRLVGARLQNATVMQTLPDRPIGIIRGLLQVGDALMRGSFHFLENAFLPQRVVKTPSVHGVFFFHGMVEVKKSDFKACGLAIPSTH